MESFKNLYSRSFFEKFTAILKEAYSKFDETRFIRLIYDEHWEGKEFKQRMRHITHALTEVLPSSYKEALHVLTAIAPQCRGIEYLFFPDYVEVNGMEHAGLSIRALEAFTPFSTSEFAVRPFIARDPERMLGQMMEWAHHESEHVRRLASEGCRPRLPWATRLDLFIADPGPILPILEVLKADSSEYVRKSVANNLNDISKDHPAVLLNTAEKWLGRHPHTDWIVKHACRSLLKQGNPEALNLFGLGESDGIGVDSLCVLNSEIKVGEELSFTFEIQNKSTTARKLRIEYEIGFVKANGKLAPKRFKMSEKTYDVGSTAAARRHSFKRITTRRYYAGTHRLAILVNGHEKAAVSFDLHC